MGSQYKRLHILIAMGICAIALLIGSATRAIAQTTTSATDQGTPAALARGAHPLGSYGGGNIDTVNLFNGNLSVAIPLAAKDGRGGLGVSVALSYNSKIWRTEAEPVGSATSYSATYQHWETYQPELTAGWSLSAGRMTARKSGTGSQTMMCGGTNKTVYLNSLTTLTFTAPDGTEYSFRDDTYDGQFRPVGGGCSAANRGTVWYTTDGTAATFVSTADIYDKPYVSDTNVYTVSGHVFLRDGTRFNVQNGLVVWMEDRNGNRVNYFYSGTNLTGIRDTLGREITITQPNPSQPSSEAVFATIVAKDAQGYSQTTTIYGDKLSNVLRESGGGTPTLGELWAPILADASDTTPVDFPRISRIEFPSSVSNHYNYVFKYNRYGELSRIVMPLGGRVFYEYGAGDGVGNSNGALLNGIYRRVTSRKTYLTSSTLTAETRTSYDDSRVVDTASRSNAQSRLGANPLMFPRTATPRPCGNITRLSML